MCRELSVIRNREKDFNLEKGKIEDKLLILTQSIVPKNLTATLKKEIGSSLAVMDRLSKSSELFDDFEKSSILSEIFNFPDF